jgi:hypothetical protein
MRRRRPREEQRYMASEWAFFHKKQRVLAAEFGFKTVSAVGDNLRDWLTAERPDCLAAWWTYGEDRKQLLRDVLGEPVLRQLVDWSDLGDLWVE